VRKREPERESMRASKEARERKKKNERKKRVRENCFPTPAEFCQRQKTWFKMR
jgi:hypothetical protein